MQPKFKKVLINTAIILPALFGVGFIAKYLYDTKKSKIEDDKPPKSDPPKGAAQTTEQVKQSLSSSSCNFPLKKGSKNSCVKQLQQTLINSFGSKILPKYGADSDWGSETEKAVKEKLNISSIKDADELAKIIAGLQTKATTSTENNKRMERALTVINSITGSGMSWQAVKNSNWWKTIEDYGAYQNTNLSIPMNIGDKMNMQDYQFKTTTASGFLIIECVRGANEGLYMVSPYDVKVV